MIRKYSIFFLIWMVIYFIAWYLTYENIKHLPFIIWIYYLAFFIIFFFIRQPTEHQRDGFYFYCPLLAIVSIFIIYEESQKNREMPLTISQETIQISGYFPNQHKNNQFYFNGYSFYCYQKWINFDFCDFISKYKNQPAVLEYDRKSASIIEITINEQIIFSKEEYLNLRRTVYHRIARNNLFLILLSLFPFYFLYQIKQLDDEYHPKKYLMSRDKIS